MANTSTIRRVGTFFPALCLVVIVLLVAVFCWLTILGLPGPVLRRMEQEANARGIELKLGAIRLAPTSGLAVKAEGVQVRLPYDGNLVDTKIRKLLLKFKLHELLVGNSLPSELLIVDGESTMPIQTDKGQQNIRLQDYETRLKFYNRGTNLMVQAKATLAGISERSAGGVKLSFDGKFDLPKREEGPKQQDVVVEEVTQPQEVQKFDLTPIVQPHDELIQKTLRTLNELKWSDRIVPEIQITVNALRDSFESKGIINISDFQWQDLTTVDVNLEADYKNEIFTIRQLNIKESAGKQTLHLQGNFYPETNNFNFRANCTASVAFLLSELQKIPDITLPVSLAQKEIQSGENHYDDISLMGSISLSDDFKKPINYGIRGNIKQSNIYLGKTLFNTWELGFYLNNGDININRFALTLPDGSLEGNISIKKATDTAEELTEVKLVYNLPIPTILELTNEFLTDKEDQSKKIVLPENLSIHGNLSGQLDAMASLKKDFNPASSELIDLIPSVSEIKQLNFSVEKLQYDNVVLLKPNFSLETNGINYPIDLTSLTTQTTEFKLTADEIRILARSAETMDKAGYSIAKPVVELDIENFEYQQENDKLKAGKINLNVKSTKITIGETFSTEETASNASISNLDITQPVVDLDIENLEYLQVEDKLKGGKINFNVQSKQIAIGETFSAEETATNTSISDLDVDLTGEQQQLSYNVSSGSLRTGKIFFKDDSLGINAEATAITCNIADLTSKGFEGNWKQQLLNSKLNVHIRDFIPSPDIEARHVLFDIKHPHNNQAVLTIKHRANKKEVTSTALVNYENLVSQGELFVDLKLDSFPLYRIHPMLNKNEAVRDMAIQLPKEFSLSANGHININNANIRDLAFSLTLPELVRKQTANFPARPGRSEQEKKVNGTILTALSLSGKLNKTDNLYDFCDIKLSATHTTGTLEIKDTSAMLDFSGSGSYNIRIKEGSNSIRPDVVDQLIGSRDAHFILRDFRFDKKSGIKVDNISSSIVLNDKVTEVTANCNAVLSNTDFLIGALEEVTDPETNQKTERIASYHYKDPYSRVFTASCGVNVKVLLHHVQNEGSANKNDLKIILTKPKLHYDDKPWIERMKLPVQKQGKSIISGKSIVFDLNNNSIALNELEGTVYPAYAFGMFFCPLQYFMKDVILHKPVNVYTNFCQFPIARNSTAPIKGLIHVTSTDGAHFNFLGTKIPLKHFSGFINLSDKCVFLDKMNSSTWGGQLDGALKIGISSPKTTIDGQLTARNLDLQQIGKSYKTALHPGNCNGYIRFQSPSMDVKDIRAYGDVTIRDANLFDFGIFQTVGYALSSIVPDKTLKANTIYKTGNRLLKGAPLFDKLTGISLTRTALAFDIRNGHLHTKGMTANGQNLDVDMWVDVNLSNLGLNGRIRPRINSLPSLLIYPVYVFSDIFVDIKLGGTLEEIKWDYKFRLLSDKEKKQK